jgi:hypothetical protein
LVDWLDHQGARINSLARDSNGCAWRVRLRASLLTDGLPKVEQFAVVMIENWQNHGWQQAACKER